MSKKHTSEVTIVGTYLIEGGFYDNEILVAKDGDLYYPLTNCCEASATGSADGGTCCRNCYDYVESVFGMCWTQEEWEQARYEVVE